MLTASAPATAGASLADRTSALQSAVGTDE